MTTRGRLLGGLLVVVLVAAITVPAIVLSRRDHELVPAWRLGTQATVVEVQRLADRLGIPGEVRRTRGGWEASEGGVRLVVRRRPGLPWVAGPVENQVIATASGPEAARVAKQLAADVGGPKMEIVGVGRGLVIMRPVIAGQPVSAMPWRVLVEKSERVFRAAGWLNRPTPVLVTPEQLRRDGRLLPRRVPDNAVSVSTDAD